MAFEFSTLSKVVRKYAVIYGVGALGALQALKLDVFSFPPAVRLYFSYVFSGITVICIFLAGTSMVDIFRNIGVLAKKMKEIDDEAAAEVKKVDIPKEEPQVEN